MKGIVTAGDDWTPDQLIDAAQESLRSAYEIPDRNKAPKVRLGDGSGQGGREGKDGKRAREWEHGSSPAQRRREGGDLAREWLPVIAGKGRLPGLAGRREGRGEEQATGRGGLREREVGVYSNTVRLGNATRTVGRKPVYKTHGGRKQKWRDKGRGGGWGGMVSADRGNFVGYYGTRRASAAGGTDASCVGTVEAPGVWKDPRLDIMREEWFRGKRCLDIGCNVGIMTMSMAYKFRCEAMEGVDCDAALIAQARRIKRSIRWPDGEDTSAKLYFKAADAVGDSLMEACGEEASRGGRYDTVTCLSVTKWVHLNHGDEGLLKMLRRIWFLLKEGGMLLLEPQPWRSYHRRRNMSNTTKHHYTTIQIRPENFPQTLRDNGFQVLETLTPSGNLSKGFNRAIYVCRKGALAPDATA